ERDHQESPDDQPDDHPHDGAGELRSGSAPKLVLEAGHGAEREPPEDATDHVPDAGPQEDIEEGARTAGLGDGRTELEAPGREQGDEDQTDALNEAPLQRAL